MSLFPTTHRQVRPMSKDRLVKLWKGTSLRHAGAKGYLWLNWKEYAKIDLEDYERLRGFHWSKHHRGVMTKVNGKAVFLHRLVLLAPDKLFVKFKNKDKTDCRKINLIYAPLGKGPKRIVIKYPPLVIPDDLWDEEIDF